MAENEQIGGVSIGITGDYSSLVSDFARAQQVAQQAGQGIASALDVAMSRADGLSESIASVGASAVGASAPVEQFDSWIAKLNQDIEQTFGADKAIAQIGEGAAKAAPELENLGSDLNNVKKASHDVGEEWGRDQEKIDAAIKTSRAEFRQFTQDLKSGEAQMKQLGSSIQNGISNPLQFAQAQVKTFTSDIGVVGVVSLGVAGAIVAVGAAAFGLVASAGAAAEATGNLADRLNLTFTQTRQLEEMAQIAGVSINGLQMASFRMAEALEDASGQGRKVAQALTDVGVSGRSSGQLLTGFLEKLAEIPDDTKRIALAHEVMGRSSQQILPLIKNYAELQAAVKALGNSLDEDGAKKLQGVDDEVDKLHIAWNRLKTAMAVKLTPTIEFVITKILTGGGNNDPFKISAAQIKAGEEADKITDYSVNKEALAAKAWQEAHARTVAGMREALTATATEIKTLESSLSSTVNPLSSGDRKQKQEEYNAALAKQASLTDAIAAATTKEHDIKVKAIKYQTAGAEVLSALLADEANKHKTVAAEIAKTILAYQNLSGASLTPMQVLALRTADAKIALADLAKTGFEKAPILKSALDLATDAGKALSEQMRDTGESTRKAFDESPYAKLESAMQRIGATTQYAAEQAYKYALNVAHMTVFLYDMGVAGAADVTLASQKVAELHKKLQEAITGTSLKTSDSVKKAMHDAEQASRRMFDSLERDLAKDLVQWKGFAESVKAIFQTLAQDLLQIMLKITLKPLEDKFSTFLGSIFKGGGGIGSLFSGGAATVTGAMPAGFASPSVAGLIPAVAANTAATTADTVSTTANTAGDAVNTTATVADAVATGVNAGATVANAIATAANTAATVAKTATEVTSTISYLTSETANTVATTANTGVMAANTAAMAALTAAVSAAAGVSAAGGVASGAGGIASAVGGIAGGAVSGVVGAVAGVVGAISSVIGNFQMAHMNTSLGRIEVSTRGLLAEALNLRVDLWSQYNHMYDRLGEVWNTLKDMGGLKGGGSGSLISFTNTTFNGGATQADADRIAQSFVTQLQRAGAIR